MSPNQILFDVCVVPPFVPDSNSSIGTASSPTLLTSESVRSSLNSSHGTPTVKFAPLPQTDPNRKRSLAPLGASARSRRRRFIQQEDGSLLWSTDLDVQEEDMEDPFVAFAKFIKRTGKTLWQRARQGSKAVSQENASHPAEPVLDISSAVHPEKGQRMSEEVERGRRASWSPSAERRTLNQDKAMRRCTSDLSSHDSVVP